MSQKLPDFYSKWKYQLALRHVANSCACFSVDDGYGKGGWRPTQCIKLLQYDVHDAGELEETTFAAAECQEGQRENFTVNVTFNVQIQNHKVLTFLVNIN